jgi:hypothetical protein
LTLDAPSGLLEGLGQQLLGLIVPMPGRFWLKMCVFHGFSTSADHHGHVK